MLNPFVRYTISYPFFETWEPTVKTLLAFNEMQYSS